MGKAEKDWFASFLFNLTIICVISGFALFAQEDTEFERQKKELEETKKKLERIEEKIKTLTAEERSVLQRIEMVGEKLSLTRRYINQLARSISLKEREIEKVKREITHLSGQIKRAKENLSSLLFLFYKINRFLPLEIYLESRTLPEVYRKAINLKYLGREGRRNIENLSSLKKELELKEKTLVAAYKELSRLVGQKVAEEKSLKSTKELEDKILKRVKTERERNQKMRDELRAAKARLEKLIQEFEKRREARRLPPGSHFMEVLKGNLPWPYKGKVVSYFGSQFHPKYKTQTKNTGIDIECPVGAEVSAIGKGRVVYAERFMGYGNMVIIDHREGYYTIYSDLLEITVGVGQEVERGSVIGRAKENLHFEIRREGKPVNPLDYLAR